MRCGGTLMTKQGSGRFGAGRIVRSLGQWLAFASILGLGAQAVAGPIGSGGGDPRSPAEAMDRLAASADSEPSGIYALDLGLNFNSLDAVVYDPKTERLSLIGHFDRRFIGPRIPYLQHLAALLEIKDEPEFSLERPPGATQALRARTANGPALSLDKLFQHFDEILDADGSVTWLGRSVLLSLGLSPIKGHRAPGFLGAEAESVAGGGVRIASVMAASPANEAGLRRGDEILKVDGKAPASAEQFARLVRFAGNGNTIGISYRRDDKPTEASVTLRLDPDSHPWFGTRREDVDAALPEATKGRPTVDRVREYARGLEGGFQVPPELLRLVLDLHDDNLPKFFGEASNTQLARAMFDADYSVVKPIGHRTDLKERLTGYHTLFEEARRHPAAAELIGGKRIWVSVASVTSKQSPSGETLAIFDVKMRINMRGLQNDGNDAKRTPAEVTAYADMLSKFYDDFAEDYPVLHELSEAAKLAAAANWIKQKTPAFRLPAEGRVAWTPPTKVPGMAFAEIPHGGGASLSIAAHGGVNLSPCISNTRICVVPFDRGVVDPPKADLGKALPDGRIPAAGSDGRMSFNGKPAESVTLELNKIRQGAEALRDAVADRRTVAQKSGVDKEEDDLKRQIGKLASKPNETPREKYEQAGMLLNLAMIQHARGNDTEAIKQIKEATKAWPNHPSLNLLSAATSEQDGNRRQAIADLREYLGRVKDNPDAERWLKRLEREEGEGVVRPTWAPPRLQPTPGFGTAVGNAGSIGTGVPGGTGTRSPGGGPPSGTTPPLGTAPRTGTTPPTTGIGSGTPPVSGRPPVSTGQPPSTATTAPNPLPTEPRSAAGTRQIATTTDMADADRARERSRERVRALAVENTDPCNFDQGRLNADCNIHPQVSLQTPIGRAVEPPAANWQERQDELRRARLGWQHRLKELESKPKESWTPEEKEDFNQGPNIEKLIQQEEKKAETQVKAGNTQPPPPLPDEKTIKTMIMVEQNKPPAELSPPGNEDKPPVDDKPPSSLSPLAPSPPPD